MGIGARFSTHMTVSLQEDGGVFNVVALVVALARLLSWQVNLAVGGDLPGMSPGPDTPFPQTLQMDYVRVYECVPSNSPCYGATHVTCL